MQENLQNFGIKGCLARKVVRKKWTGFRKQE
jgi:hypothetical protein